MQRVIHISVIPSLFGGANIDVTIQNYVPPMTFEHFQHLMHEAVPTIATDVKDEDLHHWVNHVSRIVSRALENHLMGIESSSISRPNAQPSEH